MKKEIISTVLSVLLIIAVLCGCQKQTGWVEKDGNTYYYLEDGSAATGWLELDGSHYHFSSDGHLEKGFREIDGETFYFRADGTQVSGWLELDGKLFYLRQSGSLVTGWLSLDGQRYYLTEDGAATGICTVDGSTYVFDCDGRLTSGWATLENGTAFGDLNFIRFPAGRKSTGSGTTSLKTACSRPAGPKLTVLHTASRKTERPCRASPPSASLPPPASW